MPIQRIFEEVEAAKKHIENLSVQGLAAEIREHAELLLLDIRELQERILLGSIPGAKDGRLWAHPSGGCGQPPCGVAPLGNMPDIPSATSRWVERTSGAT